jgi:hypothetical protein
MHEDSSKSGETPVPQMIGSLQEVRSNLAYIRKELPGLEMPEDQRDCFLEICAGLAESVERLGVEVGQLQDESQQGSAAIDSIRQSIRNQVTTLDNWVKAARSLAAADPGCVVVRILIEESGANMLLAYTGIWNTLERLQGKA